MTGCGFGDRVVVERIRVERSAPVQPGETTLKLGIETGEVIRTHLVDRDKDQKRRRRTRRLNRRILRTRRNGRQPDSKRQDERASH